METAAAASMEATDGRAGVEASTSAPGAVETAAAAAAVRGIGEIRRRQCGDT